jgi:hypothetical protein
MNKQKLTELLKRKVVSVKFKKKDGSERLMKCTLLSDIVPVYEKKTQRIKPENEDTLTVWDLEKEAFRSFKVNSIIEYSALEEGYEL